MTALLVPLDGAQGFAQRLLSHLPADLAEMSYRRFPDGETYVRYLTSPHARDVILVAALDRPDAKTNQLLFAAAGARDLGARRIGLIVPYLPYMRQDARFADGEVITSTVFAALLSTHVDWLVTVDPHLHRWTALSQIYTIPTKVVNAAGTLADWIAANVEVPLLIGPDEESQQWVARAAARISSPHMVLTKQRHGDRSVSISTPDLAAWRDRQPVILDDTISSAHTMIETVRHIKAQGMPAPVCCAIHGVYDDASLNALRQAGAARVVTSNTIDCETAEIDISGLIAAALPDLLKPTD